MDARLFLCSCLLSGAVALAQPPAKPVPTQPVPTAQDPTGQAPAKPAPTGQAPAAQDPDKPVRTAADEISDLTREKERLEREIAYAQQRVAGAKRMLAEKLGNRTQSLRAVKFQVATPPAPVARPPMKKARVMTDEERSSNTLDVMLTVDGQPVRQGQFDELVGYLRTVPGPEGADAAQRNALDGQRAMFELVRTASVQARFHENPAEAQMADVLGQIQQGAKASDLVAKVGTVPGAQPDGTLEVTPNSFLGVKFEQTAFSLKPGQHSRPFLMPQGYVILECKERIATDGGGERVKVCALLIAWQGSPEELQSAQVAAATGQVDIVVRDAAVLELLPAIYRPAPAPNEVDAGANQLAMLQQALAQLDAEIKKVQGIEGNDAKQRLSQLQQQRDQMQAAIEEMRKKTDAEPNDGDVKAEPVKPPVKK